MTAENMLYFVGVAGALVGLDGKGVRRAAVGELKKERLFVRVVPKLRSSARGAP